MKNITIIKALCVVCAYISLSIFTSCDDFLEKPNSNDVTEDTIFSSRLKAESFLWETYMNIVPCGFPITGNTNSFVMPRSMSADFCDEAKIDVGWSPSNEVNAGGFTLKQASDGRMEDKWAQNWVGIRMAYIFMDRVNDVPDIPDLEKEQMKAECKVLIALRYLRMFKRYGGLPIVKKRFNPDDDFNVPRGSVEETVDFIVGLCTDVINSPLPDVYESKWRGRATKGVAYSILSQTYLFAASPLFNTDRPYLEYDKSDLVCYGNTDIKRWEIAAQAARDVITWAQTKGNVSMINSGDPFHDYGTAVSKEDNAEIIFAYKGDRGSSYVGFYDWVVPQLGTWKENHSITTNFLPFFYKADGSDQVWNEALNVDNNFTEYTQKMDELEPRFKQMGWVFDQYAYNNVGSSTFRWSYDAYLQPKGACKMVKFMYQYAGEKYKDWTVFRLAEFYLNLAEAVNEYKPNDQEAYDALNEIRRRAGLPEVNKSDSRYATQSSFRELVRRERAIELYAEDHRPHDLRRWKLPLKNQYWGGPLYTFEFKKNATNNGYTSYKRILLETRYWHNRMYLYCFPLEETNKGVVKQNPGY